MGTREQDQRLTDIRESGGHLYSISRLNTMHQCQYQAYLNYVADPKPPSKQNIWAVCGGAVHDTIEACIKGEKSPTDMCGAIRASLDNAAMFGVDFPRDKNGGTVIKDNWVKNMDGFASHFTTPRGEFETEQLAILPLENNNYMMGYIDAIRHNSDGTVDVIDWKTSSMFRGAHLLEAGRQLIVYTMALEHVGMKVRRAAWCMLKYADTWWIESGKKKRKTSEWRYLVRDLKDPLYNIGASLGYSKFELDMYYDSARGGTSLDSFPENIRTQFHSAPLVKEYEITPKLRQECLDYIDNTIALYDKLGNESGEYRNMDFEKDSFFCSALCGYSDVCERYQAFKVQKSEPNEDDALFL